MVRLAVGLPVIGEITLANIEQLSKKMRTHHCAFGLDKGFILLASENALMSDQALRS
jgi:hypothetical protein